MSSESNPDSVSDPSVSKRKRGRPKGAKTQALDQVVEIPRGCQRCNSTEYRVLAVVRQRQMSGVIMDFAYNLVTWRRCQCKRCQVIFVKRDYRNV